MVPAVKKCTICGAEKPSSEFYKKTPTRIHARCKSCMNAYRRDRYKITRESEQAVNRKYYQRNAAEWRERHREYYRKNSAAWSQRYRDRRYGANAEEYLANQALYRTRSRKRLRKYAREFYHRDIEESRRKGREAYHNAPSKDRWNVAVQKRRARVRVTDFTPRAWAEIKARYGHKCLRCGKSEPQIKLTIDHVIPLSRGGTHVCSNIQPLCAKCNRWKWYRAIDYRHDAKEIQCGGYLTEKMPKVKHPKITTPEA